jgi:protein-L-isoaspartate(D-aspartate) O-methyltransferase
MSATSMVDQYLRSRGIRDPRVLTAMGKVPREQFVPEAFRERAYSDHPLPIGHEQTISQPYIVALMTEALELTGSEKVLEIGTGSGYQSAILAELAKSVFSVERIHALAKEARSRLEGLGYHNVSVRAANGTFGWVEYAPYDAVLVTAAAPTVPKILIEQLKEGGRMICPLSEGAQAQRLCLVRRVGNQTKTRILSECSFVPFIS